MFVDATWRGGQNQGNQQNIQLNNPIIILPTSDEEMRHARSSRNYNNSSEYDDEYNWMLLEVVCFWNVCKWKKHFV